MILRGACYAVHSAVSGPGEERILGAIFGASSVLTPFALGAAIGGIASGRVPSGDTAGDPIDSWLNPTSMLIGVLAVATSSYLAAVWLTADAARAGHDDRVEAFRKRALATGVVAGAISLAGLSVLRSDAERVYDGLTAGAGLAAVLASARGGGRDDDLRRAPPARAGALVSRGGGRRDRRGLGAGAGAAAAARADRRAGGRERRDDGRAARFAGDRRGDPDPVARAAVRARAARALRRAAGRAGSLERIARERARGRRAGVAAAAGATLGVPLMVFSDPGVGLALGVVLLLLAVAAAAFYVVPQVAREDIDDERG